MYKTNEFAKLLNVSAQTLRNWEKNKKLVPITLPGGQKRYTDKHLRKIMGEYYGK